ncbi:MAG TPA: hypothetical protein VMB46_07010 [Methanomassiliicoccales archaeon]|nr:hypothetical protein [Methanomassiliicoccales archaeon]
MPTALEIVLAKFTGKIGSKHRAIIRQINKYEDIRTRALVAENQAEVLATRSRKAGLVSSADVFQQQAEVLRKEKERLEKNISELIDELASQDN